MTRHNLDSHISWLLSHEVTFPATVYATNSAAPTAADIVEEEFWGEEIIPGPPRTAAVPARQHRVLTNVAQEFIRPPLPSAKPPLPEITRTTGDSSMGNLSSASRSNRPGLLTQHQLATPASTSGTTSSAGSHSRGSGLTRNYAAQLSEEKGDTPSARKTVDRRPARFPRAFEPPQTPGLTPRSTVGAKTIDSVDLTGDDRFADLDLRSSSSDATFGPPVVLWREDSASRAEPPVLEPEVRTSKKRKSGDISPERSRRVVKLSIDRIKTSQSQPENLDGFVDIDDVPKRSATKTPSAQTQRSKAVQPCVELNFGMDALDAYQITETISTVQSRTRKSISRVSSFTSGTPSRSTHIQEQSARRSTESTGTIEPCKTTVQVAASPAPKLSNSQSNKVNPTPQKSRKRHVQRTIQDSEDDENFSDVEKQASCSPRTPVKATPRVVKASISPSQCDLSMFSPANRKAIDFTDSKPRVGSPLRPISRNITVGRNQLHSPARRDVQTKSSTSSDDAESKSDRQGNGQTPTPSLGLDDKKLVTTFVKDLSTISLYHERVKNLIVRNSIAVMAYHDEGAPAPTNLKEARKALLDKDKAYNAAIDCGKRYQSLMNDKKLLARQIWELLETNTDTSDLEGQQSVLTLNARNLENEIVRLLYDSGAVQDGFGTGSDDNKALPSTEPSKIPEASILLPFGSSSTGSAQVIMQTQLPSLQSRIAASHDDRDLEVSLSRSSSANRGLTNVVDTSRDHSPPRPEFRNRNSIVGEPDVYPRTMQINVTKSSNQPIFHRDPSPAEYDFDGNDFDELLQDEEDLQIAAESQNEIAEIIEDDFGDSEDDVELLEAAQDFENRQSLAEPVTRSRSSPSKEWAWNERNDCWNLRQISENDMYTNVDVDGSLFGYAWSTDVKIVLRDRFDLTGFRKHQLEAINATLAGKDVFVLMPTGGGKSLCYQLPAIVQSGKTKGVTIVISPLLSLMEDQVQHLRELNLRAGRISGDVSPDERARIMRNLDEEHPEHFIQLLYVSPEMLNNNQTLSKALTKLYRNKKLARIVIDEAHCVSSWGHDFRPDYKQLVQLRVRYPGVPFIALTATATPHVQIDLKHNLGLPDDCLTYKQSFNRPNISYEVRDKSKKTSVEEIAEMITTTFKGQSGIIYELSRANCEKLAEELRKHRIKAQHYHATMDAQAKIKVQNDWQSGKVQVVVATIAFGMGIDKKDVRFVIHYTIPKSLEGYYQETGRAGRDGKKSKCYLYYSYHDASVLKQMINPKDPKKRDKNIQPEQIDRLLKMVQQMVQFCQNKSDCRRQQVLSYFGEPFAREACRRTCDNCSDPMPHHPVDMTKYAVAATNLVKRVAEDDVTMTHCRSVFRGSSVKKVKDLGHDQLEEFGSGKELSTDDADRLFLKLTNEDIIMEDHHLNRAGFPVSYMKLGKKCRKLLTGKEKFFLDMPTSGKSVATHQQRSKPQPKSRNDVQYPSTALTSPLAPSPRANRSTKLRGTVKTGTEREKFIATDSEDEEDAFEPVAASKRRTPAARLGPPITSDDQLASLPDRHRQLIHQFVEEAKVEEEKMRNRAVGRQPIFTEANLRNMVIRWTLTLDDMRKIPDINVDRVNTYGKKLLPIVTNHWAMYQAMGDDDEDRDIDPNHQNIIDLITDDEESEEEEDFELEPGLEEAILAAEKSPFFTASATGNRNSTGKPRGGRGGTRGFKRGKTKNYVARKSTGSTSGQSNAGVRKRNTSGASKRSRGSNRRGSSIVRSFSNQGGSSRGGGGGIGMMPT